ncbi:uncharacterized protein L203_105660 [Cryptococcus depauperatus CBS 7841]|uniref:[histone H3]-trimethyl-L-lysine(9) demethylase n=1 Tax=Cryptococcus depauperatus CBS 7841 TaxID=1295531 RepID=A0A1E3IF66_9TREE|nr:specific transcriptional repressor [Cryptococcus depauperatus CBS 7841]
MSAVEIPINGGAIAMSQGEASQSVATMTTAGDKKPEILESIGEQIVVEAVAATTIRGMVDSPANLGQAESRTKQPRNLQDQDASKLSQPSSESTEAYQAQSSTSATGTTFDSTKPNANVEALDGPNVEEGPKYIQPDHFYPLSNYPNSAAASRGIPNIGDGWLSPEDDPQALRGIPVFKPTLEEFQDFESYAQKTTAWGQYSGITKVIPPPEWTTAVPPIQKSSIANVRIIDPIQQNLIGSSGLFRIANVVRNKRRPLTVEEWFKKCKDKKHSGPGPKDVDWVLNRDSKEAQERREKVKEEMKKAREKRRERRQAAEEKKTKKVDVVDEGIKEESRPNGTPSEKTRLGAPIPVLESQAQSVSLTARTKEESIDSWYASFKPTEDWLPENTRPEDYTADACATLERRFWKNMGLGEPSWYGADMEGSLFMDDKTSWNVAHLPNLLNRWDLTHLPGVNTPYLYFGMWGASFAWHVEDMDLFSINYIHFGAPKFWYAIPQMQAERFERVLEGYFTEESRQCDQFLRHKAFAVSPYRLANDGMHVNMLVHNQGEFVITYPRGYHAGFNMGFNCAESVNFALESWVELGRRAKACNCVNHSVKIDVDEMLAKDAARIQGEQELLHAIAEERRIPKKRLPSDTKHAPRKRIKLSPTDDGLSLMTGESKTNKKRSSKILGDGPHHDSTAFSSNAGDINSCPCLFCPDLGTEGLLPVFKPQRKVYARWKPRQGEMKVHHSCALAMPGVGIEDKEIDGKWEAFVVGVENVESARWNLKCLLCSDKKLQKMGAKIQCTKGKCPRAFHVSCAKTGKSTSLNIWEVETPILPAEGELPLPPGTNISVAKDIKVELLCPQHNPEMREKLEQKKKEEFKDKVISIPAGSRIKVKMPTGASVEVRLVNIREETAQVYVQDDQGVGSFFPWSSIDFREAQGKLMENEYARIHTHSRRPDRYSSNILVTPHNALSEGQPNSVIPRSVHPRPLRMDELLNPAPSERQRINDYKTPIPQYYAPNQHVNRDIRSTYLPPSVYPIPQSAFTQHYHPAPPYLTNFSPTYGPPAYQVTPLNHAYPSRPHGI